jgi:hypothetical protein
MDYSILNEKNKLKFILLLFEFTIIIIYSFFLLKYISGIQNIKVCDIMPKG